MGLDFKKLLSSAGGAVYDAVTPSAGKTTGEFAASIPPPQGLPEYLRAQLAALDPRHREGAINLATILVPGVRGRPTRQQKEYLNAIRHSQTQVKSGLTFNPHDPGVQALMAHLGLPPVRKYQAGGEVHLESLPANRGTPLAAPNLRREKQAPSFTHSTRKVYGREEFPINNPVLELMLAAMRQQAN